MSDSKQPAEASFLARWSRRKSETAAAPPAAPPVPLSAPSASGAQFPAIPQDKGNVGSNSSTGAVASAEMPETPHPEPTSSPGSQVNRDLPPIDSLTYEADFSPFMARDVDPGLRNQAMKKLFADPHYRFGEMDKLDIYIDDYSKSDPIPLDMLRQMYQAKSLFLFDDEEKPSPHAPKEPASRIEEADPAAPVLVSSSHEADAVSGSAGTATVSSGPTLSAEKDPKKVTGLVDPKSES